MEYMTWKEFKEIVEQKGIKDNTEIQGICVHLSLYEGSLIDEIEIQGEKDNRNVKMIYTDDT